MSKESFNITNLVNSDGCFDLQFRKDTRHKRSGSPTYYRWKIQFIITVPKEHMAMVQKAKKYIGCGNITLAKNQARLSVQKIDDVINIIIPYFQKNQLQNNKKQDFDLWQTAAAIIYRNKGIPLSRWQRNDLLRLMEIHKSMAKYKQKPRKQKWHEMAKTLSQM